MDCAALKGLLRERYSGDEWLFFEEAKSAASAKEGFRSLDAYAVNTNSEKGFLRVAFEIKTHRSDFLAELALPQKRAFALSVSNEFYFVAPEGVIKEDEVPENAGYLLAGSRSITLKKKAPYREIANAAPIDFFVSLLKKNARPLSTRKLFRYAGNELSFDELSALIDDEVNARVVRFEREEVERRVKEELVRRAVADDRADYALRQIAGLLGKEYEKDDALEDVLALLAKANERKRLVEDVDAFKREFNALYRKLRAVASNEEASAARESDDDLFD